MASTSDIRNGMCINFNSDIYKIVEFLHVKPGKGAAFVRTKLKSITTGRVLENTFPAGAKLDEVRVEYREYQYLYPEGDAYTFMNNETYEQITVPGSIINAPEFLEEGMNVKISVRAEDEMPLTCELPSSVVVEVTYAEPGIKGDTATNTLRPCTVSTGAKVMIPLFVNVGDKIKVNTETREYMERVKA
ncbi:MAG TPA: elongation factor P [Chitinophagales bacterium]|jgi:elongation factor P|nr:elongation factor P [Chitinophagales bacterium]HQD13178.1 elongation factor P [Chitinophagales bacterium]HQO30659.1 elongation factor P [Chitinophagales bacterium]HQO88336.1 elongation factor P [Chitinophagales bacterium]